MQPAEAIIAIIAGCVLEIYAIRSRHFYWQKAKFSSGKEMPNWIGRLVYALVGATFLLVGLNYFMLSR